MGGGNTGGNLAISAGKNLKNNAWRTVVLSTPYSQTFTAYGKRLKDDLLKYPGISNYSTDAMVNRMKADNLKEILDNPNMLDKHPILGKNVEELLDPNLQFKLELDRQGKILNNRIRNANINLFNAGSSISGSRDETGLRNYLNTAKANTIYNLDKAKAGVNNSMKAWNDSQKKLDAQLVSDRKNLENAMKEIKAVSDKANGVTTTTEAAKPVVEAVKNDKGFMNWIKDKWNELSPETKRGLQIGGVTAASLTSVYGLYKIISAIMNSGSNSGSKKRKRRVVEEYDDDEE